MRPKLNTSSAQKSGGASGNLSASGKTDQSSIRNQAKDSIGDEQKATNNISEDNISKKATTCDRLSKMLLEGGSSDDKRPILRVNLIKKSSRPLTSFPTNSLNRRNLQSRTKTAADPNTATDTSSKAATPDSTASKDSIQDSISRPTKVSDAKPPQNPRKFATSTKKTETSARVSGKQVAESDTTGSDVSKSKKLVVSMIRDISKTISREDLDEMLSEINSVIGEIQSNQPNALANQTKSTPTSTKAKSSKSSSANLERGSRKTAERRQDQLNDIRANKTKRHVSTCSSDASNCSEYATETSKQYYHRESDEVDDSGKPQPKEGESISDNKEIGKLNKANVQSIDDSKKKLRQFVIDLSSDEDTVKTIKPKNVVSRFPDRCLRITSSHAKYISPHRKRSLEDRLSRAQEAREKFLEYRANKFREILKKVEEMRAWKEEDTLNLKASVQTKLQKAAEKRKEQLDKIIRKAHDEDSKVSEIHFINNLEAQNRRHDLNSRKKEFEARLQDLQEERHRRFEEKQAKEVAAEERRKTLEAERRAKLLEIQQRRKLKDQKVEQQQQVKEKRRLERTRDRDQKISAIKEAYNAGVQTLRRKINQKHEQSERRHEINLRLIRQKAFELSIKRYNSFISESRGAINLSGSLSSLTNSSKQKDASQLDTQKRGLQLKPFNTKKFCNLCQELIGSEAALFSHLRSETHYSSINEHYGDAMLTTNEVVEIHNLRHIVDTDKPLEDESCGTGGNNGSQSDDQQSSRASSLVNYYHSSYLSQANGGITMSESDRDSLLAIEKKCRKLRHKLIVAGKPFSRDWFTNKIRSHLAQLVVQQRVARKQTTNTDASSLASTIDLSANNSICQNNKPYYLKINRITRELISVATDQRISGGGLMPAGVIHSVDRLLADLSKQLSSRQVPRLAPELLYPKPVQSKQQTGGQSSFDADQLSMASKMIEFYAIDALYLYDIVACLIAILKRMVPNVSLTSKLPSTVASHYSTLIDPISLNSYYCHRSPVLPARIYIRMIGMIQSLCCQHSDLCYIMFHSNNMIYLSDILSYRLGFIIGNESPASSISGSSSAATLSAHTIAGERTKQSKSSASSYSTASISTTLPASGNIVIRNNRRDNRRGAGSDNESNDSEEEDLDAAAEDDESYWTDHQETYKRTEDVVDDMTAGLCKLLATVTETILSRPLVLLNQLDKSAFTQRSDDFISYMVSVGIVDTESVIMSHVHQQQQLQAESAVNSIPGVSASASSLVATTTTSDHHNTNSTGATTTSGGGDLSSGSSAPNANVTNSIASVTATSASQMAGPSSAAPNSTNGTNSSSNQSSSSSAAVSGKIVNFTTSCVQFVTSLVKLIIAKLPDDPDEFGAQLGGSNGTSSGVGGNLTATSTSTGSQTAHKQQQQQQQHLQQQNQATSIGGNKQARDFCASLIRQDQTQLLATLKLTQLSGVLTLVYDLLVQSFNSLASPDNLSKQQQQQQSHAQDQLPAAKTGSQLPSDQQAEAAASVAAQLGLALASLRLINYVAYIDVRLIQATLAADEMLPMQLRHVCSYLISYLVASGFQPMAPTMSIANSRLDDQLVLNNQQMANHQDHQKQTQQSAASSKQRPLVGAGGAAKDFSPNSQAGQMGKCSLPADQLKSELISEIILLIGHFAYLNEENQLMLKSGRQPTIIELLVGLPFDYFARAPLKTILMPTLISCSFQNEQICALVCRELNLTMLTSFIEDQILSAQVESKQQAGASNEQRPHPLVTDELTSTKLALNRWRFERRFAKSKWLSAKKYFETQQAKKATHRKGAASRPS